MIYFAFVHSHLAYGIEIYGNTSTNHLNRLMILNNKLRCMLQIHHVIPLLSNFMQILTHSSWTYQILKFVHNCVYHRNKLPSIFSNCFIQNYMIHIYKTRSREHLHLEHTHSCLGQRSIKFKGSCLWNSLPNELKSVISAHSFAKHLKKFMIDKSFVPVWLYFMSFLIFCVMTFWNYNSSC